MKQTLKYGLIILTVVNSFFAWRSIERAIKVSASSDWIVPIILFSSFFILLYLSAILIKEKHLIYVMTLLCFSLSFFFVFVSWHFISIFAGFLLAFWGIYNIRKDLGLNIELHLGKSITTGKTFIIIGVALVVSSQYFYTIKNKDQENIMPKVQSSKAFDAMTSKFLGIIDPAFKDVSGNSASVDEFILASQKKQTENENVAALSDEQLDANINSQMGNNLTPEQKEEIKKEAQDKLKTISKGLLESNQEIILVESRKNLSEIIGKNLMGQEKISEIFPQMINKNITDYFRPNVSENHSLPLLPMILAIVLFLTIVPLGSFLNIFWTLLSRLIFWILYKSGAVSIGKVQKEVEIIE
jgi:hypothetical protein